jgi:hypothetical protein
MKKCQHRRTHVVIGPLIVQAMCKDCSHSHEGYRYDQQEGELKRFPAWADRAYLHAVLQLAEVELERD